ncbi:MAG: hypothetical protein B6I29_04065 [Marinitoga sp. 4572_148]|nr:MAG: hypothetical protein B6I29_04065 [Marinitoga sp. 4572_148]
MEKILVVDDDNTSRLILTEYLKELKYIPLEATNGREALQKVLNESFDLILMDLYMPVMNGFEAINEIREKEINIPIIVLTTANSEEDLRKAANVGADEFLVKPIQFDELRIRLNSMKKAKIFYENRTLFLNALLNENIKSLEVLENLFEKNQNLVFELLEKMYLVSEYRDNETYEHTKRVGTISRIIAQKIGLKVEFVNNIYFSAPLHDIGKIGISDAILLKPGKLTEKEYKIMKNHVGIGYKILSNSSSDILKLAASIAQNHHERWDGSGYPRGLKGDQIPIEGLITGVADSFDAIVSKRIYKSAKPLEEGFKEIEKLSGILYSPDIVKTFLKGRDEIENLYERKD